MPTLIQGSDEAVPQLGVPPELWRGTIDPHSLPIGMEITENEFNDQQEQQTPRAGNSLPYRFLTRMDATVGQTRANESNNQQAQRPPRADHIFTGFFGTPTTGPKIIGAEAFLKSLPLVSLKDLSEDNKDCLICLESYSDPRKNSEVPVRLPCNHVMGKDCLQRWLRSSDSNSNNNTCPMCRTVLFQRPPPSIEDRVQNFYDSLTQIPEGSRPRSQMPQARPTNPNHDVARRDEVVNPMRTRNDRPDSFLERLNQSSADLQRIRARLNEAERVGSGLLRQSVNLGTGMEDVQARFTEAERSLSRGSNALRAAGPLLPPPRFPPPPVRQYRPRRGGI